MGESSSKYRDAERQLKDAIRASALCDFADGGEITADEMASWGPERTVRAALLRRLLTAENAEYATTGVRLRGAVVEGALDLAGLNVMPMSLRDCRITAFEGAGTIFTGGALFDGTIFTNDATFYRATFIKTASFAHGTFTGDASFNRATFTSGARFDNATFRSFADFDDATFLGRAEFNGVNFGPADWGGAIFTGAARFDNAIFTGYAGFEDTIFTGDAGFRWTNFTGIAQFDNATFTSDAQFRGATFTSPPHFNGAIAYAYDFDAAQFHTTDPGPWVALELSLIGTIFHVRARVAVAATASNCQRLQAREGIHLLVGCGAVNVEDAEFLRRSILAHSASEPALPEREDPGERPHGFELLPQTEQTRWTARAKSYQLAKKLANQLRPPQAKPSQVVSLRGATAGDLVLSGVGLEDCAFADAHGLDKLRIDANCSFQRPPPWPRRTRRPFSNRTVIFEEVLWRHAQDSAWPRQSAWLLPPQGRARQAPTAMEIAGIYRDLRKGLEDAKDEPGAADFYYGEMEMRRLAARDHHQRNTERSAARGRQPSWTERRLLDAYWAVSGYGLRAWRALTALAVLLLGCAALFTIPALAQLPTVPQHVSSVDLRTGVLQYTPGAQPCVKTDSSTAATFARSLEFTARESLTLTRASGDPLLTTCGAGTALDIALRLLAPLLLGLALLAVRGRTKR